MFHAFKCASPTSPAADNTAGSAPRARRTSSSRITTTNACSECRRRKIGCDGRTPCKQCLWYKHPDLCSYFKPRQRVVPSHKVLQSLSTSLEQHQNVLKTLFPTRDVKSLAGLSREGLIDLLSSPFTLNSSSRALSQDAQTRVPYSPEDGRNLECLEEAPNQDVDWDESRRKQEPISHVSDDVNGLSLSVDRQCSYVGVSSIKAAFRVILKISPTASREFLAQSSGGGTRAPSPSRKTSSSRGSSPTRALRAPSCLREQTLVDAYFLHVHVLIPMVDEDHFRATFREMEKKPPDPSWLALFNMVLAVGTIAACKSEENGHIRFYKYAKQLLGMDAFGSGRLEALQASILMGGYYLHYMNQPNEAHAITGAAFRMALAMGLHREQSEKAITSNVEVRRKTWWTLFCMDTWASMTLGRPTLRGGPGITIKPLEHTSNTNPFLPSLAVFDQLHFEDARFCKIATNVQDRLAICPFVEFSDMAMLDAELVAWYSALRIPKQTPDPYALPLLTARAILKWRFHNLRILLHRPVLLSVAMRSALQGCSTDGPSAEEASAISKCRDIARQTIADIAIDWQPNQISGWNGVWFLFQAVMIPLVSIFMEGTNPEADQWRRQVEMALELFGKMMDWSLAARRTREVVGRVYQASKVPVVVETQPPSSTGMEMGEGNSVFWDEGIGGTCWDDMMWETFPDTLDLGLGGLVDCEAHGDGESLGWEGPGGVG